MARYRRGFIRWDPTTPEGKVVVGPSNTLQFDAILTESQMASAEITEHPVEKGANVTDHVRKKLDSVKFEAIISNEPLYDTGERGAVEQSIALDVKVYQPPQRPVPGSLFAAIGGAISSLFGDRTEYKAQVLKFNSDSDMVAETHETLKKLIDSGQLLDVFTSTSEYKDMLLLEVQLVRTADTGSGGVFQLSMQQIRRVEVKLATAPEPTVLRANKEVKTGPQEPDVAPPAKKSIFKQAKDAIVKRGKT